MSKPKAKDYRKIAREKLSGHWGTAILTTFVAALLGGTAVSTTASADVDLDGLSELAEKVNWEKYGISYEHIYESVNIPPIILTVIGVVVAILGVWGIATFILGGPTRTGLCQFNVNLLKGEGNFSDLFSHYDIFVKGLLAKVFTSLVITMGFLFFIVPGVIASYAFSMTFYVLAENPDMDAFDALKESRRLMKGHKWQLFCLQFSFIGWAILSACTLGIGSLFLTPYMEIATSAFYKQISKPEVVEVFGADSVEVSE
ncbi:MAG: DUF975 family protein [Oscillospiraceae bacterium]|nr:DUF975 family protein [Candidatus Limimonas coprohippi]